MFENRPVELTPALTTTRDLLLYALIVTPIVTSFFFLKRARQDKRTRLDRVRQARIRALDPSQLVFFQWNGHSFEAYETLGVIPECTLAEITAAYHDQLTRGDRESMLFFEAAYQALLKSRSS